MSARLPRSLFKYVTANRLELLTDGAIRFTQPGALNDPFEVAAPFDLGQDNLALARSGEDGIAQVAAMFYERQNRFPTTQIVAEAKLAASRAVPVIAAQLDEVMEHQATVTARIIAAEANKVLGILSLTENATNDLMWSHYADSYKGMVVEFDTSNEFFSCPTGTHPDIGLPTKVRYPPQRAKVNLSGDAEQSLVALFFSKAPTWAYEAEWRIIRKLADAAKVDKFTPYDIHLFRLPAKAIRSLIVGHRMARADFERVKAAKSAHPHIQLKRVEVHEGDFSLAIRDFDRWEDLDADSARLNGAKGPVAKLIGD